MRRATSVRSSQSPAFTSAAAGKKGRRFIVQQRRCYDA